MKRITVAVVLGAAWSSAALLLGVPANADDDVDQRIELMKKSADKVNVSKSGTDRSGECEITDIKHRFDMALTGKKGGGWHTIYVLVECRERRR